MPRPRPIRKILLKKAKNFSLLTLKFTDFLEILWLIFLLLKISLITPTSKQYLKRLKKKTNKLKIRLKKAPDRWQGRFQKLMRQVNKKIIQLKKKYQKTIKVKRKTGVIFVQKKKARIFSSWQVQLPNFFLKADWFDQIKLKYRFKKVTKPYQKFVKKYFNKRYAKRIWRVTNEEWSKLVKSSQLKKKKEPSPLIKSWRNYVDKVNSFFSSLRVQTTLSLLST